MYQTDQQPQQQPQQDTEQVIGIVVSTVQKAANKWQAQVQPDGSDRTRNLWTDDLNVINFISSQIGNRLAFACRKSHYTYQGQPTYSLWITDVGSPMVGSPAMAGPPMQQPQQQWTPPMQQPQQHVVVQPQVTPMQAPVQGYNDDPKQGKIHRQTATKVAAILLTNLPQEQRTMTNLLALSERLVAYYDNGLPAAQTVEDLMQRALPQSMDDSPAATGEGYTNTPPPYGDDDIPF